MNEQIKALMGQTLDEKFSGTWSTMDMQDLQKFAERFAELIVQEMCEVMKAESEGFDLVGNFGAVQGIDVCMRKVKTHFGVEE